MAHDDDCLLAEIDRDNWTPVLRLVLALALCTALTATLALTFMPL